MEMTVNDTSTGGKRERKRLTICMLCYEDKRTNVSTLHSRIHTK